METNESVVAHLIARLDADDLEMLAAVGEAAPGLVVEMCRRCEASFRDLNGDVVDWWVKKCFHHRQMATGSDPQWWLVGSRVVELPAGVTSEEDLCGEQ